MSHKSKWYQSQNMGASEQILNTLFRVPHHPSQSTTSHSYKYHITLFKISHHTFKSTTPPSSNTTLFKLPHRPLQGTTPPSSKYHTTPFKVQRYTVSSSELGGICAMAAVRGSAMRRVGRLLIIIGNCDTRKWAGISASSVANSLCGTSGTRTANTTRLGIELVGRESRENLRCINFNGEYKTLLVDVDTSENIEVIHLFSGL